MKYPATRRAFVIGVVVVGLLFQAPTHADTSPALRVRHRPHNNLCAAAALPLPQQTDIHNTQESATSAQKMVRLPAAPQDIVPSIEVAASEGPSLIDCTKAPRAYTRILGLKFPIWKPSDGDNVDTGKGDIYGALMPPLEERWKVFQVSSGFVFLCATETSPRLDIATCTLIASPSATTAVPSIIVYTKEAGHGY